MAWRLDVDGHAFAVLELPAPSGLARKARALLTGAEADVAQLMVAGLSNEEIARQRGTAVRTVANQAASIFRKMGVGSRLGLCAAFSAGEGRGAT